MIRRGGVVNILISIIVPVYNKGKFINNCISSIINQTYKNIEIILIDDGSSDNSFEVMNQWRLKDSRIKYFYQENQGVAIARNNGIMKSVGEYVYFIDADDEIKTNSIEQLVEKARIKSNADIISANYYKVINNRIKKNQLINERYFRYDELNDISVKADMFYLNARPMAQVCNKLYRLEFLKKNNIKFAPGVLAEDRLFNLFCYVNKPNIYLVNIYNYYYNILDDSRSRGFYDQVITESISLYHLLNEYLMMNDLYTYNHDLIQVNSIFDLEKALMYFYDNNKGIKETSNYIKLFMEDPLFNKLLTDVYNNKLLKQINLNRKVYINKKILLFFFVKKLDNLVVAYHNFIKSIIKFKNKYI